MLPTRPKWSPTEITSPGLIDLSASRMMPLTRFDTIFCRPKPTPTPTAPEKNASAERSMPTGRQHDHHREGDQHQPDQLADQHLDRRRQVGGGLQPPVEEVASALAAHSVSISSTVVLITSSGVMRRPPSMMPTGIERVTRRIEQTEDAQRRDRPGRDRRPAGRRTGCGSARRGARSPPRRWRGLPATPSR